MKFEALCWYAEDENLFNALIPTFRQMDADELTSYYVLTREMNENNLQAQGYLRQIESIVIEKGVSHDDITKLVKESEIDRKPGRLPK